MKQLKVGIAGFGKAGEIFHTPFINHVKALKLTTVLERNKQRSKELYPWINVVKSFEELIDSDQVDIVVITTPNDLHFSMAKEALLHGKHVVVDKPFTIRTDEADELIQLAKEKGRILTVYHNRRLDGTLQLVKEVIQGGRVGAPVSLDIRFDRFRPDVNTESWREKAKPGSGLLYDLGSHLIDMALYLFGKPDKLSSTVKQERVGAAADDFFEIEFVYNSGLLVKLGAGMLVKEKTPHFTLVGKEGKLVVEDLDPQENALKAGVFPGDKDWPAKVKGILGNGNVQTEIEIPAGDYSLFYQNLYDSILNSDRLLIKPEEARDVVDIINRIKSGIL